jgi:predicted enzyme related to lactoylglutathione lyase
MPETSPKSRVAAGGHPVVPAIPGAAMSPARTYPEGVPSWIDVDHRDVEAAQTFYGALFGWSFADATPPGGSSRYAVAALDGADAAGIGGAVEAPDSSTGGSAWKTYVAVADADAVAARVDEAGGQVLLGPSAVGEAGRWASCADPAGVPFRLWQADRRLGAQVVNSPGAWNFSDLHAADPEASATFYGVVFGWQVDDLGFASMIRLPGYGDHLAATADPDIRARQAGWSAPAGFADAIGWLAPVGEAEQPHWHVSFTVADRDATVAAVERLGGTVLGRTDSDWTREALIRDPQGAVFTASQFAPPTS